MNRNESIYTLHKAASEGNLVTFRVPRGDGVEMSITSKMFRDALSAWDDIPLERRLDTILSVRRAIKSALKKHKRGNLARNDTDAFAADCALWIAYEIKYSDGKRHLVASPSSDVFKNAAN